MKNIKRTIIVMIVFCLALTNNVFAKKKRTIKNDKIVISLVGDCMFDRYVQKNIDREGTGYPFANVQDVFQKDDITFINLETSLTNIPKPANPKKEYNFSSYPSMAKAMKDSSIEIVNLANNHSLDYGQQGFIDTMNSLDDAKVLYVGGGRNYSEALQYKMIETKGKKIGFLGYNRVIPAANWRATKDRAGHVGLYDFELDAMLPYIKEVKSKVDYLLLAIHWQGMPTEKIPANFTKAGHKLIDAGVDVVVGTHPHVMQATEFHKNGVIFYSLGNFVFDINRGRQSKSAIVQLEINPEDMSKNIKYIPSKSYKCRPVILKDQERLNELYYINNLNKKFNSYIQANGYMIQK